MQKNMKYILPGVLILLLVIDHFYYFRIFRWFMDTFDPGNYVVFYHVLSILRLATHLLAPALIVYFFKEYKEIRFLALSFIIYAVSFKLFNDFVNSFRIYDGFWYVFIIVIDSTLSIMVVYAAIKLFMSKSMNHILSIVTLVVFVFRFGLYITVTHYVLMRISDAMESTVLYDLFREFAQVAKLFLLPVLLMPVILYYLMNKKDMTKTSKLEVSMEG